MHPLREPDSARGDAAGTPRDVPVRDAATVMVIRDGTSGIEVLMLQRSFTASFVGGAHVFPGGAVDPHDRSPEVMGVCVGLTDDDASQRLGVPSGGLGYWSAAIRECFEEAGVLLAYEPDGAVVRFDDPTRAARFRDYRSEVHSGRLTLSALCAAEGLTLATDAIWYFSHWVTPIGAPRRFDTRFFVCPAPRHQHPLHDDRETIASEWVRPADALARFASREIDLILPTEKSLAGLARYPSVETLVADLRTEGSVPALLPPFPVGR